MYSHEIQVKTIKKECQLEKKKATSAIFSLQTARPKRHGYSGNIPYIKAFLSITRNMIVYE